MATNIPFRKLALRSAILTLLFAASAEAADFAPAKTSTVGNDPSSLASGDLNGDSIPDLVVTNYGDGTVSVLLGATGGLGNFAGKTDINVGSNSTPANRRPFSVAIGNVVGDANADIVVAVAGDNEITVLPGAGNGTFGTAIHFTPSAPSAAFNDPRDVVLGDVDNDGDLDLIVAQFNGNSVRVFRNNAPSTPDTFTEVPNSPFTSGNRPFGLVFADATGDGIPDILFVNVSAANTARVLVGSNDGNFVAHPNSPFTTGARPYGIAVGDLDGINGPDLAVANTNGNSISVLLSVGDTSPADGINEFAAKVDTAVGTGPSDIAIANVSGDSNPDVVVTNQTSNTVSVLEGDGTGGFTGAAGSFPAGTAPIPLVVDDFDGDNIPDAAVANTGAASTNVSVLINDNHPVGTADTFNIITDSVNVALDVLANDTDPDAGDTLTISAADPTSANGGTIVNNGTSLDYTAANGYSGPDSFQYTLSDQFDYTDGPITVSLTVGASQAPTDVALTPAAVNENAAIGTQVGTLTTTDPDTGDSFVYTFVAPNGDAGGRFAINGDKIQVADGSLLDFESSAGHTVTVQTADAASNTFAKDITITLNDVNEAPVPTAPAITTDEDTAGTSQIAPNDPDAGDIHSYAITGQGANGTAVVSVSGLVTYTPNLNFAGSDSVIVTVTDSGSLSAPVTISVTVNPVNDAPVAGNPIGNQSGTEGTPFGPLNVSGNFSDPDSTLTYSMSGLPAGTGLVIDSNTAVISGTPTDADANASQPITVSVSATDGTGSVSQQFALTITDINNTPAFTSTPVTTATQNVAYVYDITTSDPDGGDTLTITSGALPGWLTLTDNGDGTATLRGTPTSTDVGSSSITLTVSDGTASSDQSFTLTVGSTSAVATTTNGGGGGCTLAGTGTTSQRDPLMPLMMLAAAALYHRRKIQRGGCEYNPQGLRGVRR